MLPCKRDGLELSTTRMIFVELRNFVIESFLFQERELRNDVLINKTVIFLLKGNYKCNSQMLSLQAEQVLSKASVPLSMRPSTPRSVEYTV